MKLRIKGDSLRMRLSQAEVDEFANNGMVSDDICFGESSLHYSLKKSATFNASLDNHKIVVEVPIHKGDDWAHSDQVGIEADVDCGEGKILKLLIEKDFKCLTDRPNEDESDLFTNPLSKHNC